MPWKKYVRVVTPFIWFGVISIALLAVIIDLEDPTLNLFLNILAGLTAVGGIVIARQFPNYSKSSERLFVKNLLADGWQQTQEIPEVSKVAPHFMRDFYLTQAKPRIELQAEKKFNRQTIYLILWHAFFQKKHDQQTVPFTLALSALPGHVNGWATLRDEKSMFADIHSDVDLESIDFNKKVRVRAEPKSLAFRAFPPTAMDYYLRLPKRPSFHIEGNWFLTAAEGQITTLPRLSEFLDMHSFMFERTIESALEKKLS